MRYNPETAAVTIHPLAGEGNAPVELEALEFIARLILHIPDVRERQVTYCGAYANASRLRLLLRQATEDPGEALFMPILEEPTPFEQQRRIMIFDLPAAP